jgi:hypothetical protein
MHLFDPKLHTNLCETLVSRAIESSQEAPHATTPKIKLKNI